jgi:hypothetical protein
VEATTTPPVARGSTRNSFGLGAPENGGYRKKMPVYHHEFHLKMIIFQGASHFSNNPKYYIVQYVSIISDCIL